MKTETRIYIVSTTNADGDPYALDLFDIQNMCDEDFMDEAEAQGLVWSLEGFQHSWNTKHESMPSKDESVMRIIEVEIKPNTIMRESILSDLVNKAGDYQLKGVEFTQEDVDCVERLIAYGKSYEDAVDICLKGIYDVLN